MSVLVSQVIHHMHREEARVKVFLGDNKDMKS